MDIEKAISTITGDSSLIEKFKKDPVGTVKQALGSAIPADMIDKVVEGVKAKIGMDKLSGVTDAIGGLFGKNKG